MNKLSCNNCRVEYDAAEMAYECCGSPADGSSGTGCTDHDGARILCDGCWDGGPGADPA